MQDVSDVSGLCELCRSVSDDMHGTRVSLKQSTVIAEPGGATPGSQAWHDVRMWPQQAAATEHNIKQGLFSLESAPPASSVYVVGGSGTIIQDGTIDLGESACMVFDSTCGDVHLENITFTGATLALLL